MNRIDPTRLPKRRLAEFYTPDEARLWLCSPHRLLAGRRPAELIARGLAVPLGTSGPDHVDSGGRRSLGALGRAVEHFGDRWPADFPINEVEQVGVERLAAGRGTRLEFAPSLRGYVPNLQYRTHRNLRFGSVRTPRSRGFVRIDSVLDEQASQSGDLGAQPIVVIVPLRSRARLAGRRVIDCCSP